MRMPFNFGKVNCYLARAAGGFILIDTGLASQRAELEKELEKAGCTVGLLKLIVITHGDFDHIGNAAYLRERYGARIAMGADDSGMAENGDMFYNRNKPNFLLRILMPIFFRLKEADRFTPDLLLADGDDLSAYGFEARVISIPGHSKGSIGILTVEKNLFCGDLLDNTDKPTLNSIIDDPTTANTSLENVVKMSVKTVYPGHGKPFPMQQLVNQLVNPRYAGG